MLPVLRLGILVRRVIRSYIPSINTPLPYANHFVAGLGGVRLGVTRQGKV